MTDSDCLLCKADRITPWYLDDDLCWIAECTICTLPMVVAKDHVRAPDEATKAELHARLALVVEQHFTFEHWIDDEMRRIPDHYHAHARPVGGFFGHAGLRRGEPPAPGRSDGARGGGRPEPRPDADGVRRRRRPAVLRPGDRPLLRRRRDRRAAPAAVPRGPHRQPPRHTAGFFAQYWGGGSGHYSDERGHPRLRMRHMPFAITSAHAAAWLAHMRDALDAEEGLDPEIREAMDQHITSAAAHLVNS